jgi:hypothetical protein
MRRHLGFLTLGVALAGCVAPVFQRAAHAPRLSPVETTEVVDRPPLGGVLLGTAEVQATVHQTDDDCQAAALREARQAGATHVVVRAAVPGTSTKGPRCRVEAFYLPAKR